MKRVGVLGGTFNPIHIGHLAIAQTAQEKMQLEKVIFVPANIPPHKNPASVAPSKDRYHMVRLATKNNSYFEISDFEIKKTGPSYTIDTMWYLKRIFPKDTQLFFIIGGDMLPHLKSWKYIDDILKIATFIVVNRPGKFKTIKEINYYSVLMPGIDISSSYIRSRIAQKKTVRYFVPDNVVDYIKKRKLYRTA